MSIVYGLMTRYYLPWGTYGNLKIKDLSVYTVEKPWVNNTRFKSCIPEGSYLASKHISEKHGLCYILEGEWVVQRKSEARKDQRYACLLHIANFVDQVEGCIGIGDSITNIKVNRVFPVSMGVTRSTETFNTLVDILPDQWNLTITHIDGIKRY